MKVLVTGSNGFLGSALIAAVGDRGDEVIGLDTSRADVNADIAEPGDWQDAFAGVNAVIHAAAMVGMPSATEQFWRVNTLGSRHVLDAAIRAGVSRFVLLSSVTVFGNDFPDGVTEDYPTRPTGVPYTDTKIAAEHLCLDSHVRDQIEISIVRPGDIYGPGSRPWTLLPLQMIKSRRVAVPSTGVHSPVYVSDVVRGILRVANSDRTSGQIITLSGGRGVPTGEYFDHYARMLGRRSVPRLPRSAMLGAAAVQASAATRLRRTIELSPAAVRYLADRRGTYSIDKAADLLDWRPEVELAAGLETTRGWLVAQGLVPQVANQAR